MADVQYVTAEGFIQFDPQERDANGQTVVDATIKTPGTEGILVRVTIWPELQSVELKRGDWIAVDGKLQIGSFTDKAGAARQSVQISATALAVVPGVPRAEREVVNQPASGATPLF